MKKYNVKLVLTEIKDNEKEKEKALTEVEIAEARDIAEAEKVMERILLECPPLASSHHLRMQHLF